MEPKVSIVVPIYRVEKYLRQCVDSLLTQTLQEIEIILVDDGSPDSCGAIADTYALLDSRIRVIHQKNAGLGPARNSGMAIARGEYVGFVDSDDWVRPDMYRHLYAAAKACDADIAVSGHRDMAEGRILVTKVHPMAGQTLISEAEIRSVRNRLFGHAPWEKEVEAFPMSVCASVYKRTLVCEHNLRFQEILSEDTIFNLSAYRCAKTIAFTDGTDYCYRKENQVSITKTFSGEKRHRFARFLTELARMAAVNGDEECILRAKRMAIDYCRLYVGMVDDAPLMLSEKKHMVQIFAEDSRIKACWEDYPTETLPLQQRIFHYLLIKKQYGSVLALNRIRQKLKAKGWT